MRGRTGCLGYRLRDRGAVKLVDHLQKGGETLSVVIPGRVLRPFLQDRDLDLQKLLEEFWLKLLWYLRQKVLDPRRALFPGLFKQVRNVIDLS